jgi:hypothetical protein
MTTEVWQFIKDHDMGPTPLDALDTLERTVIEGLTILASRKPIPSSVRVPLARSREVVDWGDVPRKKKKRKRKECAIDSLGPLVARRTRRRTK